MDLIISNANPQPIYEQLYSQIRSAILSGELREGDLLPSIRSLAKDLRISVITTKRAYEELERDGYLYTVAGKGCYVAPKDTSVVREDCLRRIEGQMEEILRLARTCGISVRELTDMLLALDGEEERL